MNVKPIAWIMKEQTVRVPEGFVAIKPYLDKQGYLCFEWLTSRGWRRVRGGSHSKRRPSDSVIFKTACLAFAREK